MNQYLEEKFRFLIYLISLLIFICLPYLVPAIYLLCFSNNYKTLDKGLCFVGLDYFLFIFKLFKYFISLYIL